MNLRRLALYATWLSLAWAAALTGLVAVGNAWVLDRAAGGYFRDGEVPTALRVVYAAMCLSMVAIAWLAWKYFLNDVTRRQRNLGRLVMLMFTISTVMNAVSQSTLERYNAIGAAVIVLGIGVLRRRPTRDFVDLRARR